MQTYVRRQHMNSGFYGTVVSINRLKYISLKENVFDLFAHYVHSFIQNAITGSSMRDLMVYLW